MWGVVFTACVVFSPSFSCTQSIRYWSLNNNIAQHKAVISVQTTCTASHAQHHMYSNTMYSNTALIQFVCTLRSGHPYTTNTMSSVCTSSEITIGSYPDTMHPKIQLRAYAQEGEPSSHSHVQHSPCSAVCIRSRGGPSIHSHVQHSPCSAVCTRARGDHPHILTYSTPHAQLCAHAQGGNHPCVLTYSTHHI